MTKRRVCLECGTPKMPRSERCRVCAAKTVTHMGDARESLCRRCKNAVTYTDGSFDCGWTRKNDPKWKFLNRTLDTALDLGVDYFYACNDFKQRYDRLASSEPSANPLSDAEREDLRGFYVYGAFWNDPELWDGVDSHKDDVWEKQAERLDRDPRTGLAVAGALTMVAAGLFFLKGQAK